VLADDDPVRVHAHSSSAAVQLAFSVFQQPCTIRCTVPHSARLLQRQPAEQGHPRTGSQLPGRSDLLISITTFKHFNWFCSRELLLTFVSVLTLHLCVHPIVCALPGNVARHLTESSSSTGISVCGCVEVIQDETLCREHGGFRRHWVGIRQQIFPHQNITSLEILWYEKALHYYIRGASGK